MDVRPLNRLTLTLVLVLAVTMPARSQDDAERDLRARLTDPNAPLSIDLMMLGEEYSGHTPGPVRWEAAGGRFRFSWRKHSDDEREWLHDVETGILRPVTEDDVQERPLDDELLWNKDRTLGFWNRSGDVWLWDRSTATATPLVRTTESERAVAWALDQRHWVLRRGRDLVSRSLDAADETQLVRILDAAAKGAVAKSGRETADAKEKSATAGADERPAGESRPAADRIESADAFRRLDEARLLRSVREAREREERERIRRERAKARHPDPATFQPPEGKPVRDVAVSPVLDSVAFICGPAASTDRLAEMPRWITDDGYLSTQPTRTKVGERLVSDELWRVTPATGEAERIKFPLGEREVGLGPVLFSPEGRFLVVVIHANDNKDEWIAVVEGDSAEARIVHGVHDDAWVHNFAVAIGFVPQTSTLWFTSEKSGWQHLWTFDLERHEERAITAGNHEVSDVRVVPALGGWLMSTSESSAFERQARFISFDGATSEVLTRSAGAHQVVLSPDGEWMTDVHSTANRPWELHLRRRGEGETRAVRLTTSPSPAFLGRAWRDPEIVCFPARDGAMVPMRLYRPERPKPHRPAVVFVHGAGYLQNAHKWWSRYSREYMFHNWLADAGYHVIDIDYRGSAGHGRDWRVGIYGHMGGKDLDDHVDGVNWLVKNHGVDSRYVGIYGGSYGGFITLMAMFTCPDRFAAGAALRPVTDWAHYNHGYTSNILNSPHEDTENYRRSSPIHFAEGLRGHLLICHGMVDDNVHFQDSVRLVQRLIELRKEDWELAAYPIEAHGFTDPASWADEYKRIWRLFESSLEP